MVEGLFHSSSSFIEIEHKKTKYAIFALYV